MLSFRLQRELYMGEQKERQWIPWADWLYVGATPASLLLVILPLIAVGPQSGAARRLASVACSASVVSVCGYIPSILTQYRIRPFGRNRSGPRDNPEAEERKSFYLTLLTAGAVALWVLFTA
jgi:hypothetical protein